MGKVTDGSGVGRGRYILVAVSVCLMACGTMGLPNAYGVFYKPMADALGVGQGSITLHMSICNLAVGLFTPIVSRSIAAGHRMRNIMTLAGVLILASGFVIAFAPSTMVMNVAAVVRGIGLAAVSMLIITLYIGNWFVKGRGTLTGIALSGSGVGSALASPVITACIQSFGYQVSYVGYVICTVFCTLPLLLFCPLTPEEVGLKPLGVGDDKGSADDVDGQSGKGMGLDFRMATPTFFALALFVVTIVLITSLSGHMSSLAQDYGYTAQVGALLLSASMVGNVVSKLVLGAIADRLGTWKAVICSLVTSTCGLALILLNPGGEFALLASGFLFGTSFSIGSLGISLLTRLLYGDAQYADSYAVVSLVTSVASAIGLPAAGFAYDLTGSYAVPIAAGIGCAVVAGLCLAYLHWRVTNRPWETR